MDKTKQSGFSLIEILVGLVIGLVAMLAIFQTLALFESQRRTTGAGADMQQSGLTALYALEQDIRLGGFGLIRSGLIVGGTQQQGSIPCTQIDAFNPNSIFQSVPVKIVDGGTGLSDTLITARMDSALGGISTGSGHGYLIASASSTASSLTLDTGRGLKANDYILISQGTLDCTLLKVSSSFNYCTQNCGTTAPITIGDPTTVNVSSVSNAAGNTSGSPTAQNYTAGAQVIDLGPSNPLTISTFNISSGNLVQTDNYASTSTPQAANIVNIQAQYGVAAAGGGQTVNCWTDATGSKCSPSSGDWATPNMSDYQRIKAIRIAVVARSPLKEKATGTSSTGALACNTTTTAPATWPSTGLPTGSSAPPTVDLTADTSWKCYRYKVYWTVVPLRNVIWGNL